MPRHSGVLFGKSKNFIVGGANNASDMRLKVCYCWIKMLADNINRC